MNKQFKTIIIDDEPLARNRLRRLLNVYEGLFSIEAEASNGQEALELIEELKPDVIFLDVEMPLLNGFEMLARLNFVPTVIFTTAFDQYAIKAFQENSIDYLLKPIEAERLELTVQKLQKLTRNTSEKETANLLAALEKLQPKKEIRSLPVKIGDRILLIKTEDISHIDADDKYVFLHTLTGESYLTDFTLSGLEGKLPSNFVRVHRGCIINAEKIREFRRGFNGAYAIVMNNQESTKITSSRSYADEVKKLFEI